MTTLGKHWKVRRTKKEKKRVGLTISNSLKGRKVAKDVKEKIRKTLLNMYKNGYIAPAKGSHCSNEKKMKLRLANLGKHHTEETKNKLREANSGEKAYNWKGGEAGYSAIHDWVRKELGKPIKCSNCDAEGKFCFRKRNNKEVRVWTIQWANKSGKYLRDLADWINLCISCHRKYDKKLKG